MRMLLLHNISEIVRGVNRIQPGCSRLLLTIKTETKPELSLNCTFVLYRLNSQGK